MRKIWLAVWLAGCGIPDKTLLVDLEPEDIDTLCKDSKAEEFTCEIELTFGGEACSDDFNVADDCTATVGDWKACDAEWRKALSADPCSDIPASCEWIFDCAKLQ